MKCPRDGTELQQVRAGGIQLDKCHLCDGMWFDPGELDKLTASGIIHIETAVESEFGNPPVKTGRVTGYMRCPRCGEAGRLHQYQYTYLKPVLVDRCDSCLGIWLDRNELDAIIGEKKTLEEAEAQGQFHKFANAFLHFWRKK